jgi:HEAT repeat protein
MLGLLNELEGVRRAYRLYPKQHPALAAARERALVRLRAAEHAGPAAIGVTTDGVIINAELVQPAATAPAERLRRSLLELGITGLRFELPGAAEGLLALIGALSELGDPPDEADRERLLSLRRTFPGVDIVAVEASAVTLLDETAVGAEGGRATIWWQVVARLLGAGSLPRVEAEAGTLDDPRALARVIEDDRAPQEILEEILARLATLLNPDGAVVEGLPPDAVRAFLAELLGLLSPDRRRLAVAVAARHFRLDSRHPPGAPPIVEVGVVLDAVEATLERSEDVPEELRELLRRLSDDPRLADVVGSENRARTAALLARLESSGACTSLEPPVETAELGLDWHDRPWASQLFASLQPEAVRRHLVHICGEVVSVWPAEQVADKAIERLADEMLYALEVGDVDGAGRMAPMLAATPNLTARRTLSTSIVGAAREAYRTLDPQYHGGVSTVLETLGETALPSILAALAEEENLVVRKRFLAVVLRQGRTAIPLARKLLVDPRWYVVRNGIFLLRKLGDRRLPELIIDRLPVAEPPLAAEILKALVAADHPRWFQLLLAELDSLDERRARAALSVAVKIRHPEVANALASFVNDRIGLRLRDPFSKELIRALGRMRDPVVLPVLEKITLLKQWMYPFMLTEVRAEAAAAIAALEDPAARRLCEGLRHDRDPVVAKAALGRQQAEER